MDPSRISTCTYPLRERPVAEALATLAACGFTKVDLWGRPPHFSADPAEVDPAAVEAAAAAAGVRIANLGSYPGAAFASDSAAEQQAALDEMTATIDLAVRFGARSIRVRPGTGEDPAVIARIAPLFRESAAYAEARGIALGMENHQGSLAGLPDACVELCERVGSKHFGILYEPCNLLHGGVDYRAVFDRFAPWIVHVHVKDGAVADGVFTRTHLGEGDIDYAWVVESLERLGYDGDYALEYEICDIEPIETGLPRWLDHFLAL